MLAAVAAMLTLVAAPAEAATKCRFSGGEEICAIMNNQDWTGNTRKVTYYYTEAWPYTPTLICDYQSKIVFSNPSNTRITNLHVGCSFGAWFTFISSSNPYFVIGGSYTWAYWKDQNQGDIYRLIGSWQFPIT